MTNKVVKKVDLDMVPRFLIVFGAAMMSLSSLAGITIVAIGVSFVLSGTVFVTYAAGWLIPSAIAFIPAPFILCYKAPLMRDFLTAYVAAALLFSIFELGSAWYVALQATTDQLVVLENVFNTIVNMVNTGGGVFALGCLLILRMPLRLPGGRISWKRLAVTPRFFTFFFAAVASLASLAGLACVAGGSTPFLLTGPAFITYSAGWLLPTVIALLLTPALLLYTSKLAHDLLIVYAFVGMLFAAFNLASAAYVTASAPTVSILLQIMNVFINAVNLLSMMLLFGFMIHLRIQLNIKDGDGEEEVELQPLRPAAPPAPDGEDGMRAALFAPLRR